MGMAIDWNPIITVATGGIIGVLGSVLTQVTQGRRDSRRGRDERAASAAIQVRDALNELHIALMQGWTHDELTSQAPLYDFLESDGFRSLQTRLVGDVLLLPVRSVREAMTFVTDALGWSLNISSKVKEDGYRIAVDLCEYGREVIGRYLRREKFKPEPVNIASYHKAHDLLLRELLARIAKNK